MIKLVENLSKDTASRLLPFFSEKLSDLFTLFSILDWTEVDGVWVQTTDGELSALIAQKAKSKVYVCAKDFADFYELADFISRLGAMVVNCSSEITERLGVTAYSKVSLMELEGEPPEGRASVVLNDNLKPVFELITRSAKKQLFDSKTLDSAQLKKLSERAYKQWLSAASRGIFNGYTQVRAVKAGERSVLSVAIADILGDNVYIRDVATDEEFRKMGYATDCISGICSDLKKQSDRIFLACADVQTESFYKKSGFCRKEYLDVGIIEI